MKLITTLCLIAMLGVLNVNAQNIKEWEVTKPIELRLPIFADHGDIDFNKFELKDLLKNTRFNSKQTHISNLNGVNVEKRVLEDSIFTFSAAKNSVYTLSSYIETNRWQKGKLIIESNGLFRVEVDGKHKTDKGNEKWEKKDLSLTLDKGKHHIAIKLLNATNDTLLFRTKWENDKEFAENPVIMSTNSSRTMQLSDVTDGKRISSASISASGKLALVRYNRTFEGGKSNKELQIIELQNGKILQTIRDYKLSSIEWLPTSDLLSYVTSVDKTKTIYTYDPIQGKETIIAEGLCDFGGYQWARNEQFIIYSQNKKADKAKDLKRIYGPDDRLPYFRNRSLLRMIDLRTGIDLPLTAGFLSSTLNDIHPTEDKLIFTVSRMDYLEVPFRKQAMYEMNLKTFELDTIWKDKIYGGYASYSPNGKQLLVQGGPQCFGELGVNVKKKLTPNAYDSQLYIFDLKTQKVEPITKTFNPAIGGAVWNNDKIYVKVADKDYSNLYCYNLKTKNFSKINLKVDVLSNVDFNNNSKTAIYYGSNMQYAKTLWKLNLTSKQSTLIGDPQKKQLSDVVFGKTEEWNFVNKNKETIYGRVYYPPNFDSEKKHPVLVYYYGGTSPIERNFGGRYPKNVWAAAGYIVYVLQPSGATGFGQTFSARHVNGWGGDAIDDIIEGTKRFLKTHPQADADNVGCLGASYGGFTTMMLQTRTNIFKTAISHAGISDITSYWGEGYWGYTYSSTASKNSYPWNNRNLYVDNSPLFNADKFQNSILLLHGTADTNVPVGESKQYYLALKLLGKDAEMVLVDGENHWIVDYKKRQQWHKTIMSWFDFKLKNQPEQWNELYPKKQL